MNYNDRDTFDLQFRWGESFGDGKEFILIHMEWLGEYNGKEES